MALLAALPLFMLGVMSAPAAASDQVPRSSDGAEVENNSGPGTSASAEEPATTEEPASTEGSGSSDGPSSSGQSGGDPVTSEPTVVPEDEGHAPGEPVVEGSSKTAPGTSEPQAAPNQAAPSAGSQQRQRARAQDKVTICHRTNSRTNPYNQIVIAPAAVITRGHSGHTGPIFAPGVDDWGDIIPPVPGFDQGLNWPAGTPILNNGCEVPPPPDVGPQPAAQIGDVVCVGAAASVNVTVSNGANATEPASFAILVDGVVVDTVGPVAPGDSQTVTVPLNGQEDQTVTVEVRSGGEVIASHVVTVDCQGQPPDVEVSAELVCGGEVPLGTVAVTNNGQQPVVVTATVDGTPVGNPLNVAPGATETATADLSQFEDQTITVAILVDGAVAATYVVTPDCVAPKSDPTVSVAGTECPPPSTTVTLGNTGDPDSRIVFVILVDGKVVQRTAPVFGGDTTTIVGDLTQFEDQTVVVELRANGKVLGSRTIHVDCTTVAGASAGSAQPGSSTGSGVLPAGSAGSGVLPSVGAGFGVSVLILGLGLLGVGSLVIVAAGRRNLPRPRRA